MSLAELAKTLYLNPDSTLDNIVDLFEDRPQAIFYGPPGTGKTYIAANSPTISLPEEAQRNSSSSTLLCL